MDNQHQKIKGYRDLSQEEIDLMNEIKVKFAEVWELIKKVNTINAQLLNDNKSIAELYSEAEPFRWSAMARTHAQEASMALTRAIAKPTFF